MEHWGEGFRIWSHPPLLLHSLYLVLANDDIEVAIALGHWCMSMKAHFGA